MTTSRPLHVRLMERHPLQKRQKRRSGPSASTLDLGSASAAYAKKGADHGTKGPWWRVWRALERAQGRRFREAVSLLTPEAKRWFALWCFERGRSIEGARAYRAYLAIPGKIGPFDRENALYLEHLSKRVDGARLLRSADRLAARTRGNEVPFFILKQLLAQGDAAALCARFPRPSGPTLMNGEAWARHAIASSCAGDEQGTKSALERCARLGVGSRRDTRLLDLMRATLGVLDDAWATLRKPWDYPEDDLEAQWKANRGLRPEPTALPSEHAYGGDFVKTPKCPSCGHPMHAFFVFDVASVPVLRERLPGWSWLPLMGCIDCTLWLFRRDFRIDEARREVELLGVRAHPAEIADFGKPLGTLDRIARQDVALRLLGDADPVENDRTQVGGDPDWVQDFARAFCPLCFEEMTFVAALGSDWRSGFVPELTVNNGSGYQYHFACASCRTLAVFGQNT